MTKCLTSSFNLVTLTHILWSGDFAVYFEDYLMYEHDCLG